MAYPNDYDPVYSQNGASGVGIGGAIDISAAVVAGYPPVMLVTFTGTATYTIQGSHDNREWNDYTPPLTYIGAKDLIPGIRFWRVKTTSNSGLFTASVGPVPAAFGRYVRPVLVSDSATYPTVTISGQITDAGVGLAGVVVSDGTRSATTDVNGDYTIADVPAYASYTITPTLVGYAFTPVSSVETVTDTDVVGLTFDGFVVGGNGNVMVSTGLRVMFSPDVRTSPAFTDVSPAWTGCSAYRVSTRDDFAFVSGGDQDFPIAVYRISTGTLLSSEVMKADKSLATFARAVMNRRHTHVLVPATVLPGGTTALAVYTFNSATGAMTWVRNITAPTGAFGGTAQNSMKRIVFDADDTAYVICNDGIRTYPSPYTDMDVFWAHSVYGAFAYTDIAILPDFSQIVFLNVWPTGPNPHGIAAVNLPLTAASTAIIAAGGDSNNAGLSVSAQGDFAIMGGNWPYRVALPLVDGATITKLSNTTSDMKVNSFTLGDGTGIAGGYATLKILDAPYNDVATSVTISPDAGTVGGD